MPSMRCSPRTTDTQDLSARLLSAGCHFAARRVLNLSEGGMLVAGGELDVGEMARFELIGPELRSVGVAQVAHRSPATTGLRFVQVDGLAGRELRQLVTARVHNDEMQAAAVKNSGAYVG